MHPKSDPYSPSANDPRPMTFLTEAAQTPPEALRIWEADSIYICPVAGACLTLAEQKRLLKKSAVRPKGQSPYELHEIFVSFSDTENDLSRRTDRLLRRKYLARVRHLLALPAGEFLDQWLRCFEQGDLDQAVYAVAVKPGLPRPVKKEIFGIIHMNMHLTAGENAKLRAAQHRAVERAEAADDRYDRLVGDHRALKKETGRLRKEMDGQKAEIARLRNELQTPRSVSVPGQDQDAAKGRDDERFASEIKRRMAVLQDQNERLKRALELEKQKRFSMERQLQALNRTPTGEPCDPSCPAYDLCQKRILIVGGMTKMADRYREMVESQGGRFDYHDGNLKNGARTLESRFKRADLVLCPVDVNSHAACSAVKKLGKKHNKPVRMLFGSSLNAINRALVTDGDNRSITTRHV